MEIWPGRPSPLGATPDDAGTNFAVISDIAEQVVLCLSDAEGAETRLPLPVLDGGVWHGFVPGIRPGQRYGYRVTGPYDPGRGVPMICGGDEAGRTQGGNNNAYCQDNPTSWFDWDAADAGLIAFTRRMIAFRRAHPVLRRGRYLADPGYVVWFTPAGRAMTSADWQSPGCRSVTVYVDGTVAPDLDEHGLPMLDDDVLILINGSPEPVTFIIPDVGKRRSWHAEVDTFDLGADNPESITASAGGAARAGGRPGEAGAARAGGTPEKAGAARAGGRPGEAGAAGVPGVPGVSGVVGVPGVVGMADVSGMADALGVAGVAGTPDVVDVASVATSAGKVRWAQGGQARAGGVRRAQAGPGVQALGARARRAWAGRVWAGRVWARRSGRVIRPTQGRWPAEVTLRSRVTGWSSARAHACC